MLKVIQYEIETKSDDGLYNSRSALSALLVDRSGCRVGRYLVVVVLRAESRETCPGMETGIFHGH